MSLFIAGHTSPVADVPASFHLNGEGIYVTKSGRFTRNRRTGIAIPSWKLIHVDPLLERWKAFRGWPYEVSDYARVRRATTGRLLSPVLNSYKADAQYLRVTFSRVRDGECEQKKLYVHRVVGILWVPGKSKVDWQIDHLDGNSFNNYYRNLEWVSEEENLRRRNRRNNWEIRRSYEEGNALAEAGVYPF